MANYQQELGVVWVRGRIVSSMLIWFLRILLLLRRNPTVPKRDEGDPAAAPYALERRAVVFKRNREADTIEMLLNLVIADRYRPVGRI